MHLKMSEVNINNQKYYTSTFNQSGGNKKTKASINPKGKNRKN